MPWEAIETCPVGREALFMGRLWRHPYWGVRNGESGQVYIDLVDGEGWQAFDAAWWLPLAFPGDERLREVPPAVAAVDPQVQK